MEPRSAELARRARAWRNIATSATMRRVKPDWVPRPHAAHLILTYRCNLKCEACPSWQVTEHADLETDEWLHLFDQLRSLDLVKILGGEPFVRKDIVEILVGVRDIIDPYVLQLTTNGMLTKKTVEAIHAVAWPGLQLRISVDGVEKTHDKMRGVEGSWKLVTRTVAEVAELKEKYGFKLGINFAITDDSVAELDEMVAFAESMGADLIPGVCVDPFLVGTTPPEEKQQKVILIENKERAIAALEDPRVGIRRQLPKVDHLLSRFITKTTHRQQVIGEQHRFTCRELRDLLYLLPNGNVVRCGLDHRPVGNVREQSFDDIWFGDAIKPFRKRVDDCPGCMQSSVQIMSRLYGGCLLA
jgi:MoaA/NifB/PqqE/SkfB family radical SAM enzyme